MNSEASFGKRVAQARGRMTQEDLAEVLGTSVSTIKRIEGDIKKASPFEKKGIALALVQKVGAPADLFAEELDLQGGDLVSLQRDVETVRSQLRLLVKTLAEADLLPSAEVVQLIERLDANVQPQPGGRGEERGS